MANSTLVLSSPRSPPRCTKFELSSSISCVGVNLRRVRAAGIFCNYSCLEISTIRENPILVLKVDNSDFSIAEIVRDVCYRSPGTQVNILNGVSFILPEKSFGLIFGRSGSGKTTLLQLLAGLSKPTSGSINIQRYNNNGKPNGTPKPLPPEKVGIVFQFPERYFLADNVLDEIIFGWPRQSGGFQLKEDLTLNLQRAINWVGLNGISLDKDPHSLSGGYKRRLALAIQLVQIPDLLILDEPLAGLDWKARADVVKLLKHLKKELTILVVSHDLREMAALVDHSWRMDMGGFLIEEPPPV